MSQLGSISAVLRDHLISAPENAKSMIDLFESVLQAAEWTDEYVMYALEGSKGISDGIDKIIDDTIRQKYL